MSTSPQPGSVTPARAPASQASHAPAHAPAQASAQAAGQPATARFDSVLVVGNDAVLAARPATAVQLAHAALRAGFDVVVPVSWGDELVAEECARQLAQRPAMPAIFCACPGVAQRALRVGPELAPFMISLVPPPVAVSQYLRTLYDPRGVRLTYAGRCAGAQSDAYDARITPEELLRLLADRGISVAAQPDAFDAVVPPDRRRFHSLPGGLPTADTLRSAACPHAVVELSADDFAAELAQHLLGPDPTLVDGAVRLGCACAGVRAGCAGDPRLELVAVEPPRAATPVVEVPDWMVLDLNVPVPRAARDASDLVAAIGRRASVATDASAVPAPPARHSGGERAVERVVDDAADAPQPARRRSPTLGTPVVRPAAGVGPTARGNDGRVLPRAYVARRRSGPRPALGDDAPPVTE